MRLRKSFLHEAKEFVCIFPQHCSKTGAFLAIVLISLCLHTAFRTSTQMLSIVSSLFRLLVKPVCISAELCSMNWTCGVQRLSPKRFGTVTNRLSPC